MKITIGDIVTYLIISAWIGITGYGGYLLIISKTKLTDFESFCVAAICFTGFLAVIFVVVIIHQNWDKKLTINFKLRK